MEFRKSVKSDVPKIMSIIKQAQDYFKKQNIDQWQNGYPNEEVINNDIKNNQSYVMINEGNILATTVISFEKELSYENIIDGKWLTNGEYGVIHRIAVDNNYKGLGLSHKIIKYAENLCLEKGVHSIKVDTHEDNIPMQSLLKKSGFKYCGVVYLEDGVKRIAFEKTF
ncbi:GNAT family N-acetyltransferase [Terrisporobacter sp.]